MSTVRKVTDADAFVAQFDQEHWTHLRKVIRNFRYPEEFYWVKITGERVGAIDNALSMLQWCLENVARQPGVRTECAAISSQGDYFFLRSADAMAFYFTWGDALV